MLTEIGAAVILLAWVAIALLEILSPAWVIRWRRAFLDRRSSDSPAAGVARFFDRLTGERADLDAQHSQPVLGRVRMFGFVNLLLALIATLVLVAVLR
jgi:hypothetical protein